MRIKPDFGDEVDACHPCKEAMDLLLSRRSTTADTMTAPGPSPTVLNDILEVAARVPDHRRVVPYRFIVMEEDVRIDAGKILSAAFLRANPDAAGERTALEQNRFLRAPVVVAVVACLQPAHKTPQWEQVLTVGAVCQNMLIASSASGFAAQWLTEWYAFDPDVQAGFGLVGDEKFAGFIYIGTAGQRPKERKRVKIDDIVSRELSAITRV